MKDRYFETELEKIEIPSEIEEKIRMGIMMATKQNKRRRKVSLFVKSAVGTIAAASFAFLILLNTNNGFASSISGYSKDILNWQGAVKGTKYLEATNEINVSLGQTERISNEIIIPLNAIIKDETIPHYKPIFAEYMSIGQFKLIDSEGKEIDPSIIEITSDAVEPVNFEIVKPNRLLEEEQREGIERFFKGSIIVKDTSLLDNSVELNILSFVVQSAGNQLEIEGDWKLHLR